MTPYPLLMKAVLVEKIWGGRRLATLGKDLPLGAAIGESWEVSDYPGRETTILNGPFAGRSFHEACVAWGGDLLDGPAPSGRFPLLVKYLDAAEDLSVQVHPSDDYCAAHDPANTGKDESWIVLAAESGARLAHGVRAGITANIFAAAIENGAVDDVLCWHAVQPGDVFHNPPGTVHALGAGIVVAEIQQRSDATYRLYDWGRMGKDGKPRTLDIGKALAVSRFAPAVEATAAQVEELAWGTREHLVATDFYRMTRDRATRAGTWRPEHVEILCVVEGRGRLVWSDGSATLTPGCSVVLPVMPAPVTFAPDEPSVFVRATR